MSFNKIILVGNLGKDPELRYTPQGKAVCSFSMATNEKRRDKAGELQDVTTWFKVTLWGNQAENASKYLSKGRPVYIEGRLRIDEWTDRDNNNRYTLDVQATDMQFISAGRDDAGNYASPDHDDEPTYSGGPSPSSSSAGASSSGGGSSAPSPISQPAGSDDDIPF